jgi:hypothetical protein
VSAEGFSTSAYALRAMAYRLNEARRRLRRAQDFAERDYLRTLKFTDEELLRYRQRIVGIERRLERKIHAAKWERYIHDHRGRMVFR